MSPLVGMQVANLPIVPFVFCHVSEPEAYAVTCRSQVQCGADKPRLSICLRTGGFRMLTTLQPRCPGVIGRHLNKGGRQLICLLALGGLVFGLITLRLGAAESAFPLAHSRTLTCAVDLSESISPKVRLFT